MLNRIKSHFRSISAFETLVMDIENLRKDNDVLVLVPQSTGNSWLGVKVATYSLFRTIVVEIPHEYSTPLLNEAQLVHIGKIISDLQYKQVIFSGFLPYFSRILDGLAENIKAKVVYHGFLAELAQNELQKESFNTLLHLCQTKKIHAIGFVKKGLALTINTLYALPTFEIILPNPKIADGINNTSNDTIKIGCLVNAAPRKNLHTQAVAAMLIDNAELHLLETKELNYLPQNRLFYHNTQSHDEFVQILSQMTVNMHVSFAESWGQVLSESISQGVPCIASYTSSFFDYNEDLKQKLIVDGFDDSWQIYKKLEQVLKEKDSIAKQCIEYAHLLNNLSKECVVDFLSA